MLISLSPYRTVPNPTALAGDYRTLSLSSAEPEVVGTTWAEDLLRRRGSYYNDEVLARAPDLFPVPQFRWMELVSEFRARRLTTLEIWHDVVESPGVRTALVRHWIADGVFSNLALARIGRTRFHAEQVRALEICFQLIRLGDHLVQGARRGPVDLGLPARQAEIVSLVARGLRNAEIGSVLGISSVTVRNQLSTVFDKLGVSTRAELVSLAMSPDSPPNPQSCMASPANSST